MTKTQGMSHVEQIVSLRKIEGQVRGLQKMVEEGRYCVDILMQVQSAIGALERVHQKILSRHLEGCVSDAIKSGSELKTREKVEEVIDLISRFKRG